MQAESGRLTLFFCLVLLYSSQLWSLEPGTPQQQGFMPDRMVRIDRAIEAAIDAGEIPGAVALIARNGKLVYHESFGYADIESRTPMRKDSIFRIASMTKAITTVAIMMLYEQGHFQLNDPISEFIPEFANPRVIVTGEDGKIIGTRPAKREIRIIDLLSHASGISYAFIPSAIQRHYLDAGVNNGVTALDLPLAENIRRLAAQPLLFDPGSAFAYGLSTDVLGYLVERVSGQPLDRFLDEQIFTPLGMPDTYFYLPGDKAERLATLYAYVEGAGLVKSSGNESDLKLDNPDFPVEGAKRYFSGGAGLSSTGLDYVRFLQMLLNDGKLDDARLLGRKSVELMRTARVDWDGDERPDFSLGFEVYDNIGQLGELGSVGSWRWGGAFYTSYWIDPSENLVGVLMTQVRPVQSDIAEKFRTMVYQALE